MRRSFIAAVLSAAVFPAIASAQLRYDPPGAEPFISYRDVGVIVEQMARPGDELDHYEEIEGISATRNYTGNHTTEDGDSGSGTVQFVASADDDSISFTGGASAVINGSSANIDTLYSTAYTYHQWAFD